MDCPNTLTLRTNKRTTVFSMEENGQIWFRPNWRPNIDQVVINLEADEAISGGVEYESPPSIILSWLDSPFDLDRLPGRSIHIPQSYDEEQQDHVTNFYCGEHLDFDDVHIHFTQRDGERFRIRATGKVSEMKAEVEIDTMIRFVDRNKPLTEGPRTVNGVGTFLQTEYGWECEGRYGSHPIRIRLFTDDDSFDRLAIYARSLISQEQVPLSLMHEDIASGLPLLKWKFDNFGIEPNFDIGKFYPEAVSISTSDDKPDGIDLNVFLTHPDSGTDKWILRYADGECNKLEWIPDR